MGASAMRALAFLCMMAAFTQSSAVLAAELRFIGCPVYRDTDSGKKSGCWLADDPMTGARYDISLSPTKPDWNFAILVEAAPAGVREDGTDIAPCGGIVLNPVRVSVLDQPCTRAMLPAEGYPGRAFLLPPRNVRPLYAPHDPVPQPYQARRFVIPFDFGRDFIIYQLADYYIDKAVNYALDIKAREVEITGYAATAPALVSGQSIVESENLARMRAERARNWMLMRGVPEDRIILKWRGTGETLPDEAMDGIASASLRRVEILIKP